MLRGAGRGEVCPALLLDCTSLHNFFVEKLQGYGVLQGFPRAPSLSSLHNVWSGYSCSASLRGLLIQTVHIMQKLRPSRHYGNSHPNTVSNAYLFHSLVQILHLFCCPLFQTISQCLRLSLWNLFCT